MKVGDSQEYLGRNSLVKRLALQVGSAKMAVSILINRGDMTKDGKLTDKGKKRDAMTAEERALDRAARMSGYNMDDYTYNPITNKTKLKANGKK